VRRSERAQDGFAVGLPGERHAHYLGIFLLDGLEELGAIHDGHSHVGNDGVIRFARESFQSGAATLDKVHVPLRAHVVKRVLEALQDKGFIIHK
jgi:hypothetical protein